VSKHLAQKKIARRYVASLFEGLASKTESNAVAKNISELGAMIENSEDLRNFVASPVHSKETQMNVFDALAKKAKFTGAVTNLLKLLVENRRLPLLSAIVTETEAYLAEQSGTVPVSIATARKLSATDQKNIQSQIKAVIGKDIIMQAYVDESLIGGIVVQVESTLIDGSIKTKLDKLERKLISANAA
jgi:F-type H+-transporting ATPase subunit delta